MQVISFSQKEGFAVIEEPTLNFEEAPGDDDEFMLQLGFVLNSLLPEYQAEGDTHEMARVYQRQRGNECPWEYFVLIQGGVDTYVVAKDAAELLALHIALAPLCHSHQLDTLRIDLAQEMTDLEEHIEEQLHVSRI